MRSQKLKQLQAAIAAIEGGWDGGIDLRANPPGGTAIGPPKGEESSVPPEPHMLRGFHEWFGLAGAGGSRWIPPLGILLHLTGLCAEGSVVWIGRRCWPYLQVLGPAERQVLVRRSVFVDPPDDASRLWTIDLAAR